MMPMTEMSFDTRNINLILRQAHQQTQLCYRATCTSTKETSAAFIPIVASYFATFMSSLDSMRRRRVASGSASHSDVTTVHSNILAVEPSRQPSHHHGLLPYTLLTLWIGSMSLFIVKNYKSGPWPASFLLFTNRDIWRLLHDVCSMLFGGTIVISTIVEWLVVASRNNQVMEFWFEKVPTLDGAVVLPSLTVTILSGMAQASQDYGSIQEAPPYIKGSLHVLLTFAVWWAVTDVFTQRATQHAIQTKNDTSLQRVLRRRKWSNVGSCLFVSALYTLMAYKPGHDDKEK
jgi:hypothetical protein